MTEEEKLFLCGHVCMAAHRIGIYGRFEEGGFRWFDPMAQRHWDVTAEPDRKDTLVKACESLTSYLCMNPA